MSQHELIGEDDDEEVSLTKTWKAAGVDLQKLQLDAGGTLTPAGWGQQSASTLREDLPPEMSVAAGAADSEAPLGFDLTSSEKLALGAAIGVGGSGVAYLARQTALARDGAVKVIAGGEAQA